MQTPSAVGMEEFSGISHDYGLEIPNPLSLDPLWIDMGPAFDMGLEEYRAEDLVAQTYPAEPKMYYDLDYPVSSQTHYEPRASAIDFSPLHGVQDSRSNDEPPQHM